MLDILSNEPRVSSITVLVQSEVAERFAAPPGSKIYGIPSEQFDTTMAELTGQPIPEQADGISFLPTLVGKADQQKAHEYLYFEHPQSKNHDKAVRMGKWKGVLRGWKEKPPLKLELYNLEDDLGEERDVAADFPDIVKRIEAIMKEAHTPLKK